jgi:xylulose-5-phosphate/fructose-6-phosphate phosphoketolase
MCNQIDRFNLAIDVIDRVPKLQVAGAHLREWLKNQIIEHTAYAHREGIDRPEITEWKWPGQISGSDRDRNGSTDRLPPPLRA